MATPKRKPYDWLQKPQQPAPYTPGQSVQDAQKAYQGIAGQKPGDYVSQYQNRMTELYDKINNRQAFNYDVNADALYQQYKDQYQRMGKTAMQDTMGQAQAMTGGYGNTYAQTVGNQAYQGYLQRLNEMVPQLEQRAFDRYQVEGQDLYNQYGLAADADATDYGRYQDAYNRWAEERGLAYDQYRDERGFDYDQYKEAMGQYRWESDYAYRGQRDETLDRQWRDTFDYGKERDAVADQQWGMDFDYRKERAEVGDRQWGMDFDYRKDRDSTLDRQWSDTFEYGKERDVIGDQRYADDIAHRDRREAITDARYDSDIAHRDKREAITDARYDSDIAYRDKRDVITDARYDSDIAHRDMREAITDARYDSDIAYRDRRDAITDARYDSDIAYRDRRDTITDARYDQDMEYRDKRDTISDQRYTDDVLYRQQSDAQQQRNWEDDREYRQKSDQQKQDFNLAMSVIQGGKVPSAQQLKAAGIDLDTARLLAQIYTPKPSGGGGSARQQEEKAIATNFSATDIIAGSRALQRGGERGLQQYIEELILQGKATDQGAAVLYRHLHEYYAKNPSVKPDANVSRKPGNQQ